MTKVMYSVMIAVLISQVLPLTGCSKEDQGTNVPPDIIEYGIQHTNTDLTGIPAEWIDSVQANIKLHYAHTSHGEQLTVGLERIANAYGGYDVSIGYSSLPSQSGALCIFDGLENETYITPDLYWQTSEGMDYVRDVLNNNPEINVSMWCWCTQLDEYSASEVQVYLDAITTLESEFPGVTFVYMTCNAQSEGEDGYNRFSRNQEIRKYCEDNGNLLFDFAELDSWWYNTSSSQWESNTFEHNGANIPLEHPQFSGDEAGHTTYGSCEQKGRALWWLLARISGWEGN